MADVTLTILNSQCVQPCRLEQLNLWLLEHQHQNKQTFFILYNCKKIKTASEHTLLTKLQLKLFSADQMWIFLGGRGVFRQQASVPGSL